MSPAAHASKKPTHTNSKTFSYVHLISVVSLIGRLVLTTEDGDHVVMTNIPLVLLVLDEMGTLTNIRTI